MKPQDGQDRTRTTLWRPATRAIRGGTYRSALGETSEALYLTSGYSYERAEDVAARFRGDAPGHTYSRLQNPTVAMFEERLALIEGPPASGAIACRSMATGMAAMTAALLCQLSAGDHVVAGKAMFGSCRWLVDSLLPRFGITTTTVHAADTDAWAAAVQPNTRLFFLESPANPTLDIADIPALADIAHRANAKLLVDNVFASPVLQSPLTLGADIVAYSATKHIDGQGRVMGGAVLGSADFIEGELLAFIRNTGPTLSAFNAWVLLKGLETLDMRVRHASASAQTLAEHLTACGVSVAYPGLASHPHASRVRAQMQAGGTLIALKVGGGRERAFAVLNALELIDISNNVGDSRTLLTHPASTTHFGLSATDREDIGVTEDMLRLSVGLEDVADLQDDLTQALRRAGVTL